MLGDVGDHRFGNVDPAGCGSGLENRPPGRKVGLLDLDDHAAQEPGHQLIGQPGDQPRMLVGRQDDGRAFVDQSVERVKKLVLGGPFRRQEMNIIDDQPAGTSVTSTKAAQATGSHGIEEAIGKRLGGELSDVQVGVRLPKGMADAFQQVRLAQPDGTMDDQRVEGFARRLATSRVPPHEPAGCPAP